MWIKSRKKTSGGITITVTCGSAFAGQVISCSDGTTTFTKTCPSSSPYVIEFTGMYSGVWTISGVASGTTITRQIVISDIDTTLDSKITGLSFADANAMAQQLVTDGTHKLCATDFHFTNGSSYDHYYSDNSNIPGLAWNNMTKNATSPTEYTVFDDLKVTANGVYYTYTFLKDGVIVLAEANSDSNSMQSMINRGNIFTFQYVGAGQTLAVPVNSYRPASTWFTYYPVVAS